MALTCHQLNVVIGMHFNDFFVFIASIKTYQPRELNRVSYLLCFRSELPTARHFIVSMLITVQVNHGHCVSIASTQCSGKPIATNLNLIPCSFFLQLIFSSLVNCDNCIKTRPPGLDSSGNSQVESLTSTNCSCESHNEQSSTLRYRIPRLRMHACATEAYHLLASNPGWLKYGLVPIACVINHRRGPYTPTTMYYYDMKLYNLAS